MSKKSQCWLLWHYWKMLTIPGYRRLLKKEAEMDRRLNKVCERFAL